MPKSKTDCVVELLDGTELVVENRRLNDADELLNYVCQCIGVAERDYFGLKYTNSKDGEISWLDMSEPLLKQLRKVAKHRFKLGIQFFPDTIHVLQDEVTRYQFVLQTRENLLTGRWSCSMPTQALLASYIVQAEFGNYNVENHGDEYLDGAKFAFVQKADFLQKVTLFHKNHHGISPSDADWLYMKTAGKMVMYGMDVYDVFDGDENMLIFGIDVYGIHILYLNTVLHSFVWPLVGKVFCTGKEVVININVSLNDISESINIGFFLKTERDARRVTKSCNQHKEFHNSGAVKKPEKKVTRSVPCTHISTRVLPNDFKRVDSFKYSNLFENLSEIASYRDSERSNCKDSMDEDSSKDTTASNSDELNQSSQSGDRITCDTSNDQDTTEESIANIELSSPCETTEESAVHVDSLPHMSTTLDTTKGDHSASSGVILSTEDIKSTQNTEIQSLVSPPSEECLAGDTVPVTEPNVVDEIADSTVDDDVATIKDRGEDMFNEDEQPIETSEHIQTEHIDANVIIDNKDVTPEATENVEIEEEADPLDGVINTIHIAETITLTRSEIEGVVNKSDGEIIEIEGDINDEDRPGECKNLYVDQLIEEEYDIIESGSDVM